MRILPALLGLLYPLLVFAGLTWLSTRAVALLIGGTLLLRFLLRLRDRSWRGLSPALGGTAGVLGLVALAALLDDGRYMQLVPVLVNAALCAVFTRSLVRGRSMVEVLARLQYPDLPAGHVPYCRRVTAVWALFFGANALFILWLAAAGSLQVWTLYTGAVAYALAGMLFGGERVYRAWRFRTYGAGLADLFLRRIFPPSSVDARR